jgi:DNA polymerase III alpha subunit
MKVCLSNRTLWFDGTTEIDVKEINKWITAKKLAVNELTPDIIRYNQNVVKADRIILKNKLDEFDTSWNIPEEYKNIDIKHHVFEKLTQNTYRLQDAEITERYKRVVYELGVYLKLELFDLLRTLVFVIDKFKKHNIVWGVGRGSSVASYILFLLEVHDVDSVEYELNFNEFLEV